MAKSTGKRPYTTDYGLTKGHCETPRGAIRCAVSHLLKEGRKHCVIEAPNCTIDVWYNGFWGVQVSVRKGKSNVIPFKPKKAA